MKRKGLLILVILLVVLIAAYAGYNFLSERYVPDIPDGGVCLLPAGSVTLPEVAE